MAVVRYAGDRYTGLSTDTKPTGILAGAVFLETDTAQSYFYDGSSWTAIASVDIGSLPAAVAAADINDRFLVYDSVDDEHRSMDLADLAGGVLGPWVWNLETSAPNAFNNVASWGISGGSTNVFAAIIPKGAGGILAAVPNSAASGGNTRGNNAVDLQTSRAVAADVASGAAATIPGGYANEASGNYSFSCGYISTASNTYAVALGYVCNATGFGSVALGYDCDALASYALAIGGRTTSASSNYASAIGGYLNTATGPYSVSIGGFSNAASGSYGFAAGYDCDAGGDYAFAFGFDAHANGNYSVAFGREAKVIHQGSMVFADSQTSDETTTQTNELRLRFQNGAKLNGEPLLTEATGLTAKADVVALGTSGGTTTVSDAQSGTVYYSTATFGQTRNIQLDSASVGTQVQVMRNGTGTTRFTQGTSQTIIQGNNWKVADEKAAYAICVAANIWFITGDGGP